MGRSHEKTFRREADAKRFRTTVEAAALVGEQHDPVRGRIVLGDFYEMHWLPAYRNLYRPSTMTLMEGHWRLYVGPALGHRRVNSITPLDIRRLVADVQERSTVYQAEISLRLIRSLLAAAVEDQRIPRSPAAEVQPPARPPKENRFLSVPQLEDLIAWLPPRWRAFVLLSAIGGPRFGELVALHKDRLNLRRRTVSIQDAIVEVAGVFHHGPTKSGKPRTISLPAFVIDAIAEHMRRFPPTEDGLVFSDDDGGPVRRNRFYKQVWWPTVELAGFPGLRFHDLRHTAAALAFDVGAHPKAVQERLGHHSASYTMDAYGGLIEGLDRQLADKLEERWSQRGAVKDVPYEDCISPEEE